MKENITILKKKMFSFAVSLGFLVAGKIDA